MDLPHESLLLLGVILLVLSGWLVNHFASPGTSALLKLLVSISFALGFGGTALLPIDLTITEKYDEETGGDAIVPNATYIPWLVTYWSTFFLAWLILPLFRESLLSGQFTFCSRLSFGCRKAVRGYILLLLVAASAVLFLAIKMHSWHVVPVLMALGNTYGLLLVSLLLGYGLVDLPQKIWQQANPGLELRRTQIMASNADEALFEAVWELQDCEVLIDATATTIGDYVENGSRIPMEICYASCVDKLLTRRKSTAILSPELQRRRAGGHKRLEPDKEVDTDYQSSDMPSMDYLAMLHARLQAAQAGVVSAEQRWNALVAKSQFYADLVEGTVPRPAALEGSNKCCACFHTIGRHLRYIWLAIFRGLFYRLVGFACAMLSGMVLWSEATLALPLNLSPFAFILGLFDENGKRQRGLLFQLFAMLPLLYMSICVYSSLFKLRLFGRYRLAGSKQSDGVALVFNAQYLVRLQFPLGYNYLFMIKYDTSTSNCAFSHVMSNMSTVPFFGTSFSVYAPLVILALCAFTLCNGYARLLAALGFEHEDAILLGDQETLDGKVNEGITLLRRHSERQDSNSDDLSNSSRRRSREGIV